MATKLADYTPIGVQAAEVLGTAVFTPALPTDPRTDCIVVQAQVEDIYYTTDGATDPDESPAVGWLIYAGADPIALKFDAGKRPRFKRSTSGAVLQYAYGRRDGQRWLPHYVYSENETEKCFARLRRLMMRGVS